MTVTEDDFACAMADSADPAGPRDEHRLYKAWANMTRGREWRDARPFDPGRNPTIPRGSVWSYDDRGGRDVERANVVSGEIP